MRNTHLVAYDIADPARWRKVYRLLLGHGDPLQLSVFVCRLSRTERALLEEALVGIVNETEDSLMFIDVGPEARPVAEWFRLVGRSRLGVKQPPRFFIA